MLRQCEVYLPAEPVPYDRGWQWQRQMVNDRLTDPHLPDALILLEHPAVYTLGQGSSSQFLKFDPTHPPHPLHRTERGGEVTYHTIGQLVGYPILNLRHHRTDLHWYLRQLELVLIGVLANYGLNASRKEGLTGVWIDDRKIGQIGIKVSRWITMHGFALNVAMDMEGFGQIVPCGIADYGCTQLREYVPDCTVQGVIPQVLTQFAEVFQLALHLKKPDIT